MVVLPGYEREGEPERQGGMTCMALYSILDLFGVD